MLPQFREMLGEIATAGLTFAPEGGTEPNANLCMISLSRSEAENLDVDDIVAFLHRAADVFETLRQSVASLHCMVFYCWVDEMAGQLRFNVVSSMPLPFACVTRVIRDPYVIARNLLACSYLNGIPCTELELADDVGVDPKPDVLEVCVIDLPRLDESP